MRNGLCHGFRLLCPPGFALFLCDEGFSPRETRSQKTLNTFRCIWPIADETGFILPYFRTKRVGYDVGNV